VRAWIETSRCRATAEMCIVARRVRAWIETLSSYAPAGGHHVARRVRAWIETITLSGPIPAGWSPAVCGGMERCFWFGFVGFWGRKWGFWGNLRTAARRRRAF